MKAFIGNVLMLCLIAAMSWGFCLALNVAVEKTLYAQPTAEQLRLQQDVVARWDKN